MSGLAAPDRSSAHGPVPSTTPGTHQGGPHDFVSSQAAWARRKRWDAHRSLAARAAVPRRRRSPCRARPGQGGHAVGDGVVHLSRRRRAAGLAGQQFRRPVRARNGRPDRLLPRRVLRHDRHFGFTRVRLVHASLRSARGAARARQGRVDRCRQHDAGVAERAFPRQRCRQGGLDSRRAESAHDHHLARSVRRQHGRPQRRRADECQRGRREDHAQPRGPARGLRACGRAAGAVPRLLWRHRDAQRQLRLRLDRTASR